MDIGAALTESGMIEYLLVKGNIRLDAFDHHLRQSIAHPRDRRIPCVAVGNDLADHGVIERWNVVTGVDMAVDTNTRSARREPQTYRSRGGHKGLGIFGVDAAFNGVAANLDFVLAVRQRLARCNEQLCLDDV